MSSAHQSLSAIPDHFINAKPFRFGIVTASWNEAITGALAKGAFDTLLSAGALPENIVNISVPGSFELTAGASHLATKGNFDAIICLGCVIQGETRHFDFICEAVALGLTELTVKYNLPFIFGVLTTDTMEQAEARAGGKFGNKGIEAASTAIQMAALKNF